jgi:opacity protein-like surface antigen
LTAKYETTFAGRSEEFDVKSDYSDIDLGFDLGGGVQYRLAPRIAVVLDLRYSIGVLNIKNGSGTIRTRGIQIIGGVLITVT